MHPAGLGAYSLALTAVAFVMGIGTALFSHPFIVAGPARSGRAYDRYFSIVLVSQVAYVVVASLPLALATGLSYARGWEATPLLAMTLCTVIAWHLQDFVRLALYVDSRMGDAFTMDTIGYLGQLTVVAVLWQTGTLTASTALGAIAATSTASFSFGLFRLRSSIDRTITVREILAENRANWGFGRWILGTTVVAWASDYSMPLVATAFLGLGSAGILRAVQSIMGPTHVIIKGVETTFSPPAARTLATQGSAGLHRLVVKIYWITTPLMLIYCLLAAGASGHLLGALYGSEYSSYGWLLACTALSYFVAFLCKPAMIAIRASRETGVMFWSQAVNLVVFLTVGVACIYFLGLAGAGIWLVLSSVVLSSSYALSYARVLGPARRTDAVAVES